jgi:hypothetical protein
VAGLRQCAAPHACTLAPGSCAGKHLFSGMFRPAARSLLLMILFKFLGITFDSIVYWANIMLFFYCKNFIFRLKLLHYFKFTGSEVEYIVVLFKPKDSAIKKWTNFNAGHFSY